VVRDLALTLTRWLDESEVEIGGKVGGKVGGEVGGNPVNPNTKYA